VTALDKLLTSPEPSIRYRALVDVLGRPPDLPEVLAAREEVRGSNRVRALLSERQPDGSIEWGAYSKWYGAHWVLVALADLGYPPGDESLAPLREQVYGWLLSDRHLKSVRYLDGRPRRCASQEGNALYSTLKLGIADHRADELARRLIDWQWPDGGWNCDKRPEAVNSSFMESLIPLRALALFARASGSRPARLAAEQAAEVFLKRRLFRRQRDGEVIRRGFARLHYPCYWHYDVLFGLKVLAEADLIGDPRCAEALDLLEEKRLPDGGFPSEGVYYHRRSKDGRRLSGYSLVDWGGVSARRMNEFVTADAMSVLRSARRLKVESGVVLPA
jgi:hypothetical protein